MGLEKEACEFFFSSIFPLSFVNPRFRALWRAPGKKLAPFLRLSTDSMAQPFADLSNLGSSAAPAAAASLKGGNIVGSNVVATDDAPGASTQAALDRLLGGSNSAHQLALDATTAGGHSGWQPRGRAVVAAKAAVVVKQPSAANVVSTSAPAARLNSPKFERRRSSCSRS